MATGRGPRGRNPQNIRTIEVRTAPMTGPPSPTNSVGIDSVASDDSGVTGLPDAPPGVLRAMLYAERACYMLVAVEALIGIYVVGLCVMGIFIWSRRSDIEKDIPADIGAGFDVLFAIATLCCTFWIVMLAFIFLRWKHAPEGMIGIVDAGTNDNFKARTQCVIFAFILLVAGSAVFFAFIPRKST